jgi:hypothetical protein
MQKCYKETQSRNEGRGGGKESGTQEAHAGNRADPATQADAEHIGGSKIHAGAPANWNTENKQARTAQARKSKGPKGHPQTHQTEFYNSCRKQRNKDKSNGAVPGRATEAPGKPRILNPPSNGSKGAHGPPMQRAKWKQATTRGD